MIRSSSTRWVSCGLLMSSLLAGCGRADKATSQHTSGAGNAPVVTDATTPEQRGDTLRVSLGKAEIVKLNTYLSATHPLAIIEVDVATAGTLMATIGLEQGGGNIRFSQIYRPDGSTDGPFGQSVIQEVKEPGMFRLRISPSQMAENPYRGKFTVTLKLD